MRTHVFVHAMLLIITAVLVHQGHLYCGLVDPAWLRTGSPGRLGSRPTRTCRRWHGWGAGSEGPHQPCAAAGSGHSTFDVIDGFDVMLSMLDPQVVFQVSKRLTTFRQGYQVRP